MVIIVAGSSRGLGLAIVFIDLFGFGLGFILAPAIGGTLSTFGYATPALGVAGAGIMTGLSVFVWRRQPVSPASFPASAEGS